MLNKCIFYQLLGVCFPTECRRGIAKVSCVSLWLALRFRLATNVFIFFGVCFENNKWQ